MESNQKQHKAAYQRGESDQSVVSNAAQRTELYRALEVHLEAVNGFVVSIHKHLDGMMLPASNMAVAIVNMLTEKFTSTIKSKGFTVSQDCFTFDWDPSDCNELPVPKALWARNLDISKAAHLRWRDTSGVLESSFPRASAVFDGDG